jgi:hypothetical protein
VRSYEIFVHEAAADEIEALQSGKPSVVLVGVESYDDEDLQLASSSEFWELIQARRKGRSIPLAELRTRLKASPPRRTRRATKDAS